MRRIFVSYSSADSIFVDWLVARLATHGTELWYAKWEIRVGDSIVQKINDAIAGSSDIAVVLSKTSVASRWVRQELSAALTRTIYSEGCRLLPLLLLDCDVPPLLSHLKYADFRVDWESGFADLLDTIQPEDQLRQELRTQFELITGLIRRLPDRFPIWGANALSEADDALERLVDLRIQFEQRRGALSEVNTGLLGKLQLLERVGVKARSVAWADIREIHNSEYVRPATVGSLLLQLRNPKEAKVDLITVAHDLAFTGVGSNV